MMAEMPGNRSLADHSGIPSRVLASTVGCSAKNGWCFGLIWPKGSPSHPIHRAVRLRVFQAAAFEPSGSKALFPVSAANANQGLIS
jgi:hypothetical protein